MAQTPAPLDVVAQKLDGATDAVPLLLALRAKGMPPALVARATLCLGCIGPSALAAIPSLKAALRQTPGDSDVLKALWQIAGDDPEVLDAVFAAPSPAISAVFLLPASSSETPAIP